jgi:phosphate binding protein
MRHNLLKLMGLVLLLSLVVPVMSTAAQGTDEVPSIELPSVFPAEYDGDIAIAGSSTVEPVTVAMAARFNDDGFGGNITVDETGTTAGFERFCVEGSTDLSNASRPIKDAELEDCAALGREVLEFRVGTDAITIAVNQDSPVEQLTRSQLISIFTGEVTTWDQVNPEWPAEPIELYTPGTDSGTFGYFGEAVLGTKGSYAEGEARTNALLAPNPTLSENDNVLVEGILGSEYAIGYFGFAYYLEHADTLRAVAIANDVTNDDAGELVTIPEDQWEAESIDYIVPSEATAEDNSYMLSRPLFIYSAQNILEEKPQVAAFINYYLTNTNDVVTDVGYFPISTEVLNVSKQTWLDAMGLEAAPAAEATEAAQ